MTRVLSIYRARVLGGGRIEIQGLYTVGSRVLGLYHVVGLHEHPVGPLKSLFGPVPLLPRKDTIFFLVPKNIFFHCIKNTKKQQLALD